MNAFLNIFRATFCYHLTHIVQWHYYLNVIRNFFNKIWFFNRSGNLPQSKHRCYTNAFIVDFLSNPLLMLDTLLTHCASMMCQLPIKCCWNVLMIIFIGLLGRWKCVRVVTSSRDTFMFSLMLVWTSCRLNSRVAVAVMKRGGWVGGWKGGGGVVVGDGGGDQQWWTFKLLLSCETTGVAELWWVFFSAPESTVE